MPTAHKDRPVPMQSIAIFCASSDGADPAYLEAARQVGNALARRNIAVVYGGGRVGLMGAVADGALSAGGRVVGVIPHAMVQAERAHTGVSDLRIVNSMHERKALMADMADAFIALPGGYGTFDELFEIITWGQLAFHTKPVGILNVRHFYDPLLAFLDATTAAGFIQPRFRAMLLAEPTLDALLDRFARYVPPAGGGFARPMESA